VEAIKNVINDHIRRSWPEELFQTLTQEPEDKLQSLKMAQLHVGKHCHEPFIARVLQEAARKGKGDIVELLLDDGVHPDVRVKYRDLAAIDVADESIQKLLYQRGAKVVAPPVECHLYWHSLKTQTGHTQSQSVLSKSSQPYNEGIRGLIADIYPSGGVWNSREAQDSTVASKEEDSSEKHFIIHPTVEEMTETEGSHSLMAKEPESFRWIHLPMNDVSNLYIKSK
jgi:hypothetical protein